MLLNKIQNKCPIVKKEREIASLSFKFMLSCYAFGYQIFNASSSISNEILGKFKQVRHGYSTPEEFLAWEDPGMHLVFFQKVAPGINWSSYDHFASVALLPFQLWLQLLMALSLMALS